MPRHIQERNRHEAAQSRSGTDPDGRRAVRAGPDQGAPDTQIKYHASPSPLADVPMYQATNPKAPAMTQAEFDKARQIYFERCAGCHGVLRKGATGKPSRPTSPWPRGTDYLKGLHRLRQPGRHAQLADQRRDERADVDLMARYIQHDPPTRPSSAWLT